MRARRLLVLFAPAVVLSLVVAASLAYLLINSFFRLEGARLVETPSLENWARVLRDPFFLDVLLRTVQLAVTVTGLSLIVGYPTAYAMTKVRSRTTLAAVYVVLFSPLLISVVVRSYGWLLLLGNSGLINGLLLSAGVIEEPVRLIYNLTGVHIGLVHALMPFMVFPLISVMGQVQLDLKEAAMDLGAGRVQTFLKVTLPLTLPGIVAGCQIVFTLALGALVTPIIIGGGRVLVTPQQVWQNVLGFNWPRAAIEVFALLGVAILALLASALWTARFTYLGAQRAS